jgi:hypothetical protein
MALKKNPAELQQQWQIVAIVNGVPYFAERTVDQTRILPDPTVAHVTFAYSVPNPTVAVAGCGNLLTGNFGQMQF